MRVLLRVEIGHPISLAVLWVPLAAEAKRQTSREAQADGPRGMDCGENRNRRSMGKKMVCT